MNDDEKIRLLLDLVGFSGQNIDQALAALGHLKEETYEVQAGLDGIKAATVNVGAGFRQVEPFLTQAEADFERLLQETLENVQAQKAMAAALGQTADAARTVTVTTAGAGAGVKNYGQNVQALGYALNDFFSVQGGLDQRLNAISNNLPLLLAGFGGIGMALSAIIPVVGVLIRNWDQLSEALGQAGGIEIPKSADALKTLEAELKKTKAALEGYADRTRLSLPELEEYNKLSEKQVDLEKRKNEELQRRRDIEGLEGLKSEESQKTAAGVKKAIAESGGYDRAFGALRQAIENEAEAAGRDFDRAETAKQAEDLLRAAAGGDKAARDQIRQQIQGFYPSRESTTGRLTAGGMFADNLTAFSPEFEEQQKRNREEVRAAEEARKERNRQLAEAGKEFEPGAAEQQQLKDMTRERFNRDRDAAIREFLGPGFEGLEVPENFKPERRQSPHAADAGALAAQALARQVQGNSNFDADQSLGIARRSLALQRDGLDAMVATQQAAEEMDAAVRGMANEVTALQLRAQAMIREARAFRRQFEMGNAQTQAAGGW